MNDPSLAKGIFSFVKAAAIAVKNPTKREGPAPHGNEAKSATNMVRRDAEEARLSLLLKAAADHLDLMAKSVSPSRDYNGAITAAEHQCQRQIEECRLGVEQKTIVTIGSDLGWQLWSIFGKSLDWDHFASDFELGDEILSLIETLYDTKQAT